MTHPVEAILLDMGGTLRHTVERERIEAQAIFREMMGLLGEQVSVESFSRRLAAHARDYKTWAERTNIELNERDLWTKWMLPELPAERVGGMAVQLNQLYREALGQRIVFPESRDVVLELFRRGYRLGLVSNTTSSVEVPDLLRNLEISGCFETVVLSAVVGIRKPDPSILLEAAERMGVAPENCAYIGDRIDRDVAAARKAGFAVAIILRDARQPQLETGERTDLAPDAIVENLPALLDIFPRRAAPQPATLYDASLSTMYAIKNFPTLPDCFEFARRAGFARIELNHKVTSAMLEGVDLDRYTISSVHEPCPADVSEAQLKQRDWLISSVDEKCRVEGVRAIQRSIDLAKRVGAGAVVIHAGQVVPDDDGREKKLRELIDAGQQDSDVYRTIHSEMVKIRAAFAAPGFEAVKKSILELLDYAASSGIRLGLENRYHFLEYPSPDELDVLLRLAGPERVGFLFDVGHAQTLDRLGFYPNREWLDRFAGRIIGTHLHDVIRTGDHYAPGMGEVEFDTIALSLPDNAFRTCEVQTFNSPEQVKAGLKFLAERGCIKTQS